MNTLSNKLIGIGPDDKMRLTQRNGKAVYLTASEAILPHNFKKLSQSSQKLLTNGKSTQAILQEIEAQKEEAIKAQTKQVRAQERKDAKKTATDADSK